MAFIDFTVDELAEDLRIELLELLDARLDPVVAPLVGLEQPAEVGVAERFGDVTVSHAG